MLKMGCVVLILYPSNSNYSSYMDIQVLPDLYNPENIDLKGLFMHEESFTVTIPF